MTQSFNLSQLANNLDSSGRLDSADGLVNAVPIANGGTGATTASSARTNLDVAQAVYSVPSGGIIMWSGSLGAIPTGWLLCNGTSGTPDLRDRFIIGAGSSYGIGSVGGYNDSIVVEHNHTFSETTTGQSVTHNHGVNAYVGITQTSNGGVMVGDASSYETPTGRINTANDVTTHTHNVGGTTTTVGVSGSLRNLPPYYGLAYIMKS